MSKTISVIFFIAVSIGFILSACSNNPEPNIKVGFFVDSPVEGLYYESGNQSGVTDQAGRFSYEEDQAVKFYLGQIPLGQSQGKNVVTPLDLVAGAEDINHPTVVNIARFLQTLDDDANPDNGILLTPELISAANQSVNFQQSVESFEQDNSVLNAVGLLTDKTGAGARTLVGSDQAVDHLRPGISFARVVNDPNSGGEIQALGVTSIQEGSDFWCQMANIVSEDKATFDALKKKFPNMLKNCEWTGA